MSDRGCGYCGGPLLLVRAGSRFCTPKCGTYFRRRRSQLPESLTDRVSWVRADGKRPIRVDGRPASSTDPTTWASFEGVRLSSAGNGFGIMLGAGLGCYDFDHVTDTEARALAAEIPERIIYSERSMSGRGVHVFVEAPESAGSKKWQGRHERYTRERFIRMTGERIDLKA